MTKSKIFFYFCLAFISGIFLSAIITISQLLMLGFLVLGLVLISVLWKYKRIVIVGFCLIFLVLGVWRYQSIELRIKSNELKRYNDLEQDIILKGIVVQEPDVRENSVKLTINSKQLEINGEFLEIKSRVLVTVLKYPEYKYGDELKIKGELKTPPVFEGFNYKDYLAKSGIHSVIYFSEIELLNRGEYENVFYLIYAGILDFKNKLRESIYQNLSPPQNFILGAMILGDKTRMPEDLKEKLNTAGIRHITAVSGLHIVILTSVLMSLLIGLGFWRGQAFYFSIILISLFIIMIGFQASAIRAGIMGALFLLGQKHGRKSISSRAIVIVAGLMLVINPLLLIDVGFQLSFLAAIGIIYFKGIFQNWLRVIPEEKLINLRSILSVSFSAYVFTLPIIIYNFGRISLISPLTNILILPVIYWIMIFGFIFGLLGIIWGFLGWVFSLPAWFLLTYLLKVVDLFSQPWLAKTIENVHWFCLIISYLFLGSLIWCLNRKQRLRFLKY